MQFIVDPLTAQPAATYGYTGGRALPEGLPLVVFVHGAQHDHSVWAMQSRYLAHHGYGVLALDLPGHGRSGGKPLATIEEAARWVMAAVPAACAAAGLAAVPPTTVVGHSMGSLIALEVAASAPSWLAGIALVCPAAPMRVSDALLAAARDDEAKALDLINFWSSNGINHRPGTPGPGFSVFNQNRRLMERQRTGVLATDFTACNAYGAGLDRAAALTLPVLFVLGEKDQMTPPKAARALIAAIRNRKVVVVPGSGHNLMAEHPDAALDALRQWLPSVLPVADATATDGVPSASSAQSAAEAAATVPGPRP